MTAPETPAPGTRTIAVDWLARVEGEGALTVTIRDGAVTGAKLRIFEPPRFFEALLRGRDHAEVPDIVARICGICPVAYQMSAVHAIERAFGVAVDDRVRALRRLLYCGEWIESHGLHVHLLHAPDFLGLPDAVAMARDHGPAVKRGLRLKKAGNTLLAAVGGREIHPINVRVGGFWKAPARRDLLALRDELSWARDAAVETVRWVAALPFPDIERDYLFVALRHPDEYPMNEGRVATSAGDDLAVDDWEAHFEERHVAHSTALHGWMTARGPYLTGPLARYALNRDRLPPLARAEADAAGLGQVCRNPFRSIVVRAVETLAACEEAVRLIDAYAPPDPPAALVAPRAGEGRAATEAPRGLLYHRYRLAADGAVETALIVPPTSQNQPSIEEDLRRFAGAWLALDDDALRARCEQAVRNHDPCISCATHALKVTIARE
jgi:coenzyme F420-reducing hydrogenase alpha subunit